MVKALNNETMTHEEMTTVDILKENRNSVISAIKFVFKVYSKEGIRVKMNEFLNYCNKFPKDVQNAYSSKRTKILLKYMVQKMKISQKDNNNRKWNEIAEDIADQKGLCIDSLTGKFYKLTNK